MSAAAVAFDRVTVRFATPKGGVQDVTEQRGLEEKLYLGDMVEYGDTDQVFTKPAKKQTEDYITGRFG